MSEVIIKPQLACDLDLSKVKWPAIAMPKIDGVRGMNLTGVAVGRSLKPHANPVLRERFSGKEFIGLDGELAFGNWTDSDLCRRTTGVVNRENDKPKEGKFVNDALNVDWWIFDYVTPSTINLPYEQRYKMAEVVVWDLCLPYVKMVPMHIVHSEEEFLALEAKWLAEGFEGAIVRSIEGLHKSGRATVRGGTYLRVKRFTDFEGVVVKINEAKENQNEAKINELGRTERSTHQENMVPKGMVGMIQVRALKNVEFDGRIVIAEGEIVDVGPGKMTHEDRKFYFENPRELLGETIKAKFFPKGMKDALRFPTFVMIRPEADMGE